MAELQPGDRIAYAAKFLKNTGQFAGPAGSRRGTFLAHECSVFCRVRWDDEGEEAYAAMAHQWGEDYAEDVRKNGRYLPKANIAKVRSPRFALNDL